MNLNKAMIIGNLTRDPELRTTPNGTSVTSFSVATNLIWTDSSGNRQEKVEFHNVVAWRKLAEICGQYLRKGSKVYIEGRLQTRSWDDQTGSKRYITEIVTDNMIMLDSKGSGPAPSATNKPVPSAEEDNPPVIQIDEESDNSSEEVKVEEVPF
jgi:single-strand DNA-binding protein